MVNTVSTPQDGVLRSLPARELGAAQWVREASTVWPAVGIAAGLPLLATAAQLLVWSWIHPATWFLYLPTVFTVGWLCPLRFSLPSVVLDAVLGWYCFIDPRFTWTWVEKSSPLTLVLFVLLGGCGCLVLTRYYHTRNAQIVSASAVAVYQERHRMARELHDVVIQRLFAEGLSLSAAAGSTDITQLQGRLLSARSEMDDIITAIRTTIFNSHYEA